MHARTLYATSGLLGVLLAANTHYDLAHHSTTFIATHGWPVRALVRFGAAYPSPELREKLLKQGVVLRPPPSSWPFDLPHWNWHISGLLVNLINMAAAISLTYLFFENRIQSKRQNFTFNIWHMQCMALVLCLFFSFAASLGFMAGIKFFLILYELFPFSTCAILSVKYMACNKA